MQYDTGQATLWLIVVAAVGGFAVGAYVTVRYAPALARTREGVVAGLVTCALVGAALGLAAMNVYVTIADTRGSAANQVATGADATSVLVHNLIVALASQNAPLLALAALVYLLAPDGREAPA
jgi:hypothetical protein